MMMGTTICVILLFALLIGVPLALEQMRALRKRLEDQVTNIGIVVSSTNVLAQEIKTRSLRISAEQDQHAMALKALKDQISRPPQANSVTADLLDTDPRGELIVDFSDLEERMQKLSLEMEEARAEFERRRQKEGKSNWDSRHEVFFGGMGHQPPQPPPIFFRPEERTPSQQQPAVSDGAKAWMQEQMEKYRQDLERNLENLLYPDSSTNPEDEL